MTELEEKTAAMANGQNVDDQLWKQLKTIPAFRGLLRAVEARFYQEITLTEPVLDLGCGDGHFAQMTFDKPLSVGIDPWWGPLQKAQKSAMYNDLVYGMGNDMPFPDETFATVISNSVLEHIPDIQPVLNEASRVLQPNGRLVITMPSNYFTEYMGGAALLEKIGAVGLAGKYRDGFNYISRHAHTDSPQVWAERLAKAGFEVAQWQYYFSKEALRALEWGHVQGLPSAVIHAITGHWIVAPWRSSLSRTERWLRPYYEEPFNPNEGAYILIIARKKANHPIEATLPPAEPFAIEALLEREREDSEQLVVNSEQLVVSSEQLAVSSEQLAVSAEQPLTTHQPLLTPTPSPPAARPNLINYTLVLLSLVAALFAQTMFGSSLPNPARGVGWLLLSSIPLLILGVRTGMFELPRLPGVRLPTMGTLNRRRWLVLPALFFSLLAQGVVGDPGAERPFLALFIWFMAIGTALFALAAPSTPIAERSNFPNIPARTWGIAALFFLVAFGIRVVNLSTHPFILNGIEASIGLDALNIARSGGSPFSTGWLTNPTLPTFIMAIPIRLFGPSTFAIRFWSPLVGAMTAVAVYLIGERLYGREVGVITAVLLSGAHMHIHYSRMGITNVWDGLLALLALGVMAMAWEKPSQQTNEPNDAGQPSHRRQWLLSGFFIGLNAYVFTGSHLLPLMLVGLLGWALLFDRGGLQRNFSHLVAAGVMALVVALPQILFYNNNPTVFMQRANDLGIFAEQTGWLQNEAQLLSDTPGALLVDQIWRGLLAFNGQLDKSPAYRPLAPLLSFGPSLFMALGLLTAVFRLRDFKYAMLIIWFVVTGLFAGAFLLDVPNSHRLVIASPAVSLLAGIALVAYGRFILAALPETLPRTAQRAWLPVMIGLAVIFVIGDLAFYYGRFPNEHNFGDRNTEIADQVAHTLSELDANNWTVYFYGPPSMYTDFPTIPFLAPSFQRGFNLFDVEPDGEKPPPRTANQLHIFLPERAPELDLIQSRLPGGEVERFSGYYADPLFLVYGITEQ